MTKTRSGKGRKLKNAKDAEENEADSAVTNVNNSHFDASTSDNGIKNPRKEVMPVLKKQLMKKPLIKSKVVKVLSSAEVDAAENLKASAAGSSDKKQFEFEEGEEIISMEFEVGRRAEDEFESDKDERNETSDSESDSEDNDAESKSELESGEINNNLLNEAVSDSEQTQNSSQDSQVSTVSNTDLARNKRKRSTSRASMEQKIDSLSTSVQALQEMMLLQQRTSQAKATKDLVKLKKKKKEKSKSKDCDQGMPEHLTSNSDMTIYHNMLQKITDKDVEGSTIQVDDEIAFKKSSINKNRDSSSSDEKMDTSDEIADIEIELNDMNERFIADCEQEAKRRRSSLLDHRDEEDVGMVAKHNSDEIIRSVEASKARIMTMPGRNLFLPQDNQLVAIPEQDASQVDNKYIAVGARIDMSVKDKIAKGEYVDFVKLLPRDHAYDDTGRERLIRSHSSARFCFELSGNSN